MTYKVELRSLVTCAIDDMQVFQTFEDLFTHAAAFANLEREGDLDYHYVYKINEDIFLVLESKFLVMEPNLDVIQKYPEVQEYLKKVYGVHNPELQLLLNFQDEYESYSKSLCKPLSEGVDIKPLKTFTEFYFDYEDYSVETVFEHPCDIRPAVSNLDHTRIVFLLDPVDGGPRRINFRPVSDIRHYRFSISSLTGPLLIVGSYKTYPQDLLCQLI